MHTLVIRFSSLGDVVLTGAITGSLPGRVSFLTAPRYAPLAARLAGVDRVLRYGVDPLPNDIDQVIDLHGSLRARRVCLQLRRPTRRILRYNLRRRARVWFKAGAPPPRVVDRYAAAAGVSAAAHPWITARSNGDSLLLCPGAAWATKRWPERRWRAVADAWDGPIVVLGGPDDGDLCGRIADAAPGRARAVAEAGFDATMSAIDAGAVAISGDSGLLHLCAAAGVPVVGLFGPTTSADGFWCHPGVALEHDLACRPCSRHGSAACPIGDHACMHGITAQDALQAAKGLM